MHNVQALLDLVQAARQHAARQRARFKDISKRSWQFVLFLDLKKAFDSVDRAKLVSLLQRRGFEPILTATVCNLLSATVMNYDGNRTETRVGVPQGAITSPTLFNVYIDDLVSTLSQTSEKVLAFADDIALFAKNRRELDASLRAVENWVAESGIGVNYAKSGVMAIRVDRRTPLFREKTVGGVPVVAQYKYLGLVLDDCGDLKPLRKTLKTALAAHKQQISMSWAHKFPAKLKLLAWSSLLRSKLLYGLFCVAGRCRKVAESVQSFLYSSIKHMLGLKSRPRSEKLFQATLGTSCGKLVELQVHRQAVQLGRVPFDQVQNAALTEAKLHLKTVMKLGLTSTVAFLCGRLVNPHHRKQKLLCLCK